MIAMELDLSFILLLLLSLLFIWTTLKFTAQKSSPKLPPGPWTLPIIGSVHHLLSAFPHRALRDLARTHGPIMHLKLGEVPAVVISSAEIAKEIMRTNDANFSDRAEILGATVMSYGCKDIVFAPFGAHWRQLKRICMNELLGLKQVQSFQLIREEEVANLIQSISEKSGSLVNLSQMFFSFTNDVTARAAFGKKFRHKEIFLQAVKETILLLGGFYLSDLFPSFKLLPVVTGFRSKVDRVHEKLDRICGEIIEEHAQYKVVDLDSDGYADNFVDVLLKLQKEGDLEFPMTTDTIKAIILDMFIAGSETSSTVMEWLMSELMRNPSVMQKAQAEVRQVFNGKSKIKEEDLQELRYLKSVIKETLRLHPPVPLLVPRQCRETCEVNEYQIPTKTKIIVNAWAIGRDPNMWDDAESFRPERFINSGVDFRGSHFEFIPFGAGKRMCPGILFGLANIEFPLAQLLYYFDWKLPNEIHCGNLDMTEVVGATTWRKSHLCMFGAPYKPNTCLA